MCGKSSESLYGSTSAVASTPVVQEKTTKASILRAAYLAVADLSYAKQYITADDVQQNLSARGYLLGEIGNLAGSFFKEAVQYGYVTKLQGISVPSKRAGRNRSSIGVYESPNFLGLKLTTRKFIESYNPVKAKGTSAGR